MSTPESPPAPKCALCGLTEAEHRELYGTPLAHLCFSFQPDKGPLLRGEALLCRPCTHGMLPRRLLHAAGVSDHELAPEVWS
jgi:hypothetical protein